MKHWLNETINVGKEKSEDHRRTFSVSEQLGQDFAKGQFLKESSLLIRLHKKFKHLI